MLPLALISFFQSDRHRRSVTLLCLLTAGVLFAVLTTSQTKLFWYIAPAAPFLALAAGIGLSGGLTWLRARQQTLPALFRPRVAYAAVITIFSFAILAAVYYYQVGVERKLAATSMEGRYGPFLEQVRHSGLTNDLVLVDYGITKPELRDFTGPYYSPEADFYAKLEDARGMHVQVVVPGHDLPAGSWVATCDPRSAAWLNDRYHLAVVLQPNPLCALERTGGSETASLSR